jgi:hypothetical protein
MEIDFGLGVLDEAQTQTAYDVLRVVRGADFEA